MNNIKKILTICTGAVTLALLVTMSAPHIGQELAPASTISPVFAFTKEDRTIPPPESKHALVGEKPVKGELISTPPIEIDFEPPKPNDRPTNLTFKEPPRSNPATVNMSAAFYTLSRTDFTLASLKFYTCVALI